MDEKKKVKKLNKKLFIIFLIICAILGTALGLKSYARDGDIQIISVTTNTSTGGVSGAEVYYWDYNDLANTWYIFCCQHPGPLSSGTYTFTHNGTTYTSPESTETSKKTFTTAANQYSTITLTYYQYTLEGSYVTDPVESYILSTSQGQDTYGGSWQQAWWNTYLGGTGTGSGSVTSLELLAKKFHTYVMTVLGKDNTTYSKSIDYYASDGSTYATGDEESDLYWREYTINGTTVIAPNLQDYYKPVIKYYLEGEELETEEDEERADVDFDGTSGEEEEAIQVYFEEETNSWIIGPFSLEYYESSGQVSASRNELQSTADSYSAALALVINMSNYSYVSSFETGYGEYQSLLQQYRIESDAKTKDELLADMTAKEEELLAELNTIINNASTVINLAGGSTGFPKMVNIVNELSSLKSNLIVNIEEIINDLQILATEFSTNSSTLQSVIQEYMNSLNEEIAEIEENGTLTDDGTDMVMVYDDTYSYISGANISVYLGSDNVVTSTFDETTGWGDSNGVKWTFRYLSGSNRTTSDTYAYPHSEEEFYIQLVYNEDATITRFAGLDFDFTYMNAGGQFDRYTGYQITDKWTEQTEQVSWCNCSGDDGCTCDDCTCDKWDHWLSKSTTIGVQSQTLGMVIKAVRWYTTVNVEINVQYRVERESKITIEKTTVDSSGNQVAVDDKFTFDVYVDYSGNLTTVSQWKAELASLGNTAFSSKYKLKSVTVKTTDGYGKKSISGIEWEFDDDGNAIRPTYYIVEREKTGYVADGPWAGKLKSIAEGDGNNITTIEAENEVDKHYGNLTVTKEIENDQFEILSNEVFKFTLAISGEFEYGGTSYTRSAANPLELNFTITGEGTITLKEIFEQNGISGDGYIYWYGDSKPYYQVVEDDSADYYECTRSTNTQGYFECIDENCGGDVIKVTFVNEATVINTTITIDKSLVSGTAPQSGEEFKVILTINAATNGTFQYGSSYDTTKAADIEKYTFSDEEGSNHVAIVLNEANNWTWTSDYIWWTTTKAPTYTVEEVEMADHTYFYSITDTTKTSTSSVFESTLKQVETTVTITNGVVDNEEGKLKLIKLSDADDTGSYTFKVTISGKVKGYYYASKADYDAGNGNGWDEITDVNTEFTVTVNANEEAFVVADLEWYESDYTGSTKAPSFTVEEVDNDDFVSISINGKTPVTNESKISGYFSDDDTVLVTCINDGGTEPGSEQGTITINKSVIGLDNIPDEMVVTVNLTIKSQTNETFQYSDSTTYDNSSSATNYSTYDVSITLSKDGDSDGNGANWTWNSKNILWKDTEHAPYYTVSEVTVSGVDKDDYEFNSIVTQTGTVTTSTTGSIQMVEGTNHVEIINKYIGGKDLYGKLEIKKVSYNDNAAIVSGDSFNFTVKVTGTFTYDGTQYTNETLTLSADVIADGDVWSSLVFSWNENDDTPTYQIIENLTEEQIENGVTFEGMYSSSNAKTSNVQDWLAGDLVGSEDSSNVATATVTAKNGSETHYGRIKIIKVIEDKNGNSIGDDIDTTFDFKITLSDGQTLYATVSANSPYISDYIEWTGATNPTFTVEEINGEDFDSSIVISNGVENDSGEGYVLLCEKHSGTEKNCQSYGDFSENPITTVVATNKIIHEGELVVKKTVVDTDKVSEADSSVVGDTTFTINVTISIDDGTFIYNGKSYTNTDLQLAIYLKNGQEWSGTIQWFGNSTPTFVIDEPTSSIPDGYEFVSQSDDSEEGKFVDGGTVTAEVINKIRTDIIWDLIMDMGGIVWDDTESDKVSAVDGGSYENGILDEGEAGIEGVKVTISRAIVNTNTGEVYQKLSGVYAYDDSYDLMNAAEVYDGWRTASNGDIYTYTDSSGNWYIGRISVPALVGSEVDAYQSLLQADSDGNYSYKVAYYVTFSYDGQTYEPTTYMATSNTNTAYDASTISSLTSAYNELPTAAKQSESKDDYLLNSFAVDIGTTGNDRYTSSNTRTEYNNKFATILGDEDMQSDGTTTGTTSGGVTLKYSSVDSVSTGDYTKKVSTLLTSAAKYGETEESTGQVYSALQIDASTIEAYLSYPTDNNISLSNTTYENEWIVKNDSGTALYTIHRVYNATYNYMKSINLGLVQREAADVATEKDLTEMIVVINGKVITYKFNSLVDFEDEKYSDLLLQQLAVANAEVTYTLGLYSSDYYYRTAIYDGSTAGSELTDYITNTLGLSSLDTLELEVYLRYTITVYNESNTYDVTISGINDYYDNSLEMVNPNDTSTSTYIRTKTVDGAEVEVNAAQTLAEFAGDNNITLNSAEVTSGTLSSISWNVTEDYVTGSDEVTYCKASTDSLNNSAATVTIHSGGSVEIETTYRIKKNSTDPTGAINEALNLATKHNIVEVTGFSDYYSTISLNRWGATAGDLAGRIDEDSAPDNINFALNEINYYEDDTTEAPMAYITLVDSDREINGLVWEDAETETVAYSQTIGNGIYNLDEGDTLIEGMTTQLVEVISVPTGTDSDGNTIYEEYDFVWDTDTEYDFLGGSSLSELTGLNSTTTTNSMGEYEFTGISAGNYKVRFVYGDTKVLTGNDDYEVVYNGQDYKSTTYQAGFSDETDSNDNGYTENAWQDLSDSSLEAARVSDARDSEARRVYITSESEMLTYDNSSVLATADENVDTSDGTGNEDYYDELFGNYEVDNSNLNSIVTAGGYYMYAETAKIDLQIENTYDLDYEVDSSGVKVVEGTSVIDQTTVTDYTYTIDNIDFGIEERSQTKLTLDKQIKEITITTSDNEVILDAVYDIIYEIGSDGSINVTVSLNELESTGYSNIASLNRSSANQGYRYVMIDSTILQGTTLTVQYQLTVFNIGEADTSSTLLADIWDADDSETALNNALAELTSNRYTATTRLAYDSTTGTYGGTYEYGKYVGSIYYLGTEGTYYLDSADEYGGYTMLAETTVHQIIDYVDPDIEFIDTDNIAVDQSWTTTTIDYLLENNLIDPDAVILIDNETGLPLYDYDDDGNIVVETYSDYPGYSVDEQSNITYTILNDELQQFITEYKNNIVLNIDNGDETNESGETLTSGTNPGLVKATVPYTAYYQYDANYAYATTLNETTNTNITTAIDSSEYNEDNETEYAYDRATAQITLTVSRYYSSEEDGQDVDNIAEIIKVENTVGRRDTRNITGNTITYQIDQDEASTYGTDEEKLTTTVSLYQIAASEPDTSATEVITLSPPTGLDSATTITLKVLSIILVTAIITLIGIIIIKKKVLLKK